MQNWPHLSPCPRKRPANSVFISYQCCMTCIDIASVLHLCTPRFSHHINYPLYVFTIVVLFLFGTSVHHDDVGIIDGKSAMQRQDRSRANRLPNLNQPRKISCQTSF